MSAGLVAIPSTSVAAVLHGIHIGIDRFRCKIVLHSPISVCIQNPNDIRLFRHTTCTTFQSFGSHIVLLAEFVDYVHCRISAVGGCRIPQSSCHTVPLSIIECTHCFDMISACNGSSTRSECMTVIRVYGSIAWSHWGFGFLSPFPRFAVSVVQRTVILI